MTLVVVGESSAEGVPYRDWLSVGKIVVWQLRRLFPQRMFHVEVQARPGWTLEQMHQKLAESRRRPDAVIIYAGHNEFASRFGWSSDVAYYRDDPPAAWPLRLAEVVRGPLATVPPDPRVARTGAGRGPAGCPAAAAGGCAVALRGRRPGAAGGLSPPARGHARRPPRRAGVLTILVVPPGNDAGFEPNRSTLPPQTPPRGRERPSARPCSRRAASSGPTPRGASQRYRELIALQPGFAETHFRLARLLDRQGLAG